MRRAFEGPSDPVSRLRRRLLLGGGAALALPACTTMPPAAGDYAPLLFDVRHPAAAGSLCLFASIHAGVERFYPLPALVQSRWRASRQLAVEIDVPMRWDELRAAFARLATLPGEQTLDEHLDAATIATMRQRFALSDARWQTHRRLQPWALSLVLASDEMRRTGLTGHLGIDRYFLNAARERAIPIVELERAQEQVIAFAGGDMAEQVSLLRSRIANQAFWDDNIATLVDHWRRGDDGAMDDMKQRAFGTGAPLASLRARMFAARERRMAQRLLPLLEAPQATFVVIGAFHLVGRDCLQQQLRQLGARVSRVAYDGAGFRPSGGPRSMPYNRPALALPDRPR